MSRRRKRANRKTNASEPRERNSETNHEKKKQRHTKIHLREREPPKLAEREIPHRHSEKKKKKDCRREHTKTRRAPLKKNTFLPPRDRPPTRKSSRREIAFDPQKNSTKNPISAKTLQQRSLKFSSCLLNVPPPLDCFILHR